MNKVNIPRPLMADEVEVRAEINGRGDARLLLYKTARADRQLLDETFGMMNWQVSYTRDNMNCTVSVWDEDKKCWISKEDTGFDSGEKGDTKNEEYRLKGVASDSFKRACTRWGCGTELYTAPKMILPKDFFVARSDGKGVEGTFTVESMTVEETERGKKITALRIAYQPYDNAPNQIVVEWDGGSEMKLYPYDKAAVQQRKPEQVQTQSAPQRKKGITATQLRNFQYVPKAQREAGE